MLRFAGRKPTRNYLGRGEQLRLLGLFGLLALVLVLMRTAGREESWRWMFAGDTPQQVARQSEDETPIDSRRPASSSGQSEPDVVRIAPAKQPITDSRETLPGLRRDLFSEVVDDTVLRGGAEHAAFFQTLQVLKGVDEQDAATPPTSPVTFVQLFRQPESYRGEWIRVRGVVRRAVDIRVPDNDAGITKLHQLWLQPENRPDDLLAIDVLQLPPGFPMGLEVNAPATVDGVFFKRWAYPAEDGIRTAPLLLARSVVWTPAPVADASNEGLSTRAITSAVAISLGIMAAVAWLVFRPGRKMPLTPSQPDFQTMAAQDQGSDVARMLAELSERKDATPHDT